MALFGTVTKNNLIRNNRNLDVSNPFQVLISILSIKYFVLLDNNLAETGRLNFNSIGFGNIRTIGISDDNNIWVLEEVVADRFIR